MVIILILPSILRWSLTLISYVQLPACSIRVAEAIITGASFEAGKSCSIKETLECPLHAQNHILQQVRGNALILFTQRFDLDQVALLPIVADCLDAWFRSHRRRDDLPGFCIDLKLRALVQLIGVLPF